MLVDGVEAIQELTEPLRTDGDDHGQADGRVHRVTAAHPVPETEGVDRVDAELRHPVQGCGDGDEMLRNGLVARLGGVCDGALGDQGVQQPGARHAGVGEGLQSGEGLGSDDEQRGLRIQVRCLEVAVRRIDVRNEPAFEAGLPVRQQSLVDHHRSEVGATDADVDHGPDLLAGDPGPLAGAHLVREGEHLVKDRVDVGDDILAVDHQLRVARQPQRGMQHRTVLGGVDVLASEHRVPATCHVRLLREAQQGRDDVVVDQVLRQVHVQIPSGVRETRGPVRVIGEGVAEPQVGSVSELIQLFPGSGGGGVNRLDHAPKSRRRRVQNVTASAGQARRAPACWRIDICAPGIL